MGRLQEGIQPSPKLLAKSNDAGRVGSKTHQATGDAGGKMWATDLCLWTPNGPEHISIDMKRGIFQGDSLSPLLFCLCVSPLSGALRETEGFHSTHQNEPVTHLMFVDDLKVYADGKRGLEEAVEVVEKVSGAMGM